MKRDLFSYLMMIGILLAELLLVTALFFFSTHFQTLYVILSTIAFLFLFMFLLFRRIKEQSNLKPTSEVVAQFLRKLKVFAIVAVLFTFLLALVKAFFLFIKF